MIVPKGHALESVSRVSLEALAQYPLITYDPAFAGRSHIDEAFAHKELNADVVLAAIDSDVIKTYVELGLGVGIVASVAYDASRDLKLTKLEAGHLFRTNTTRVAILRGRRLRAFTCAFIELFAPHLSQPVVEKALAGGQNNYEL